VLGAKATSAVVAAVVAALAAGAIALWLRPPDLPDGSSPPVAEPAPQNAGAALPVTETVSAPSAQAPTAPSASSADATDRDAETLRRAVAERLNGRLGSQFVDYLAEQGLSRADAEVVVARLVHDLTVCAFDALRAQATEQGVAFDEVLSAVEAAFYVADGPNVDALIDVRALAQREAPCSLNALQQAGIPQTPLARLSLDLIRR
jgi:hypothetical protein